MCTWLSTPFIMELMLETRCVLGNALAQIDHIGVDTHTDTHMPALSLNTHTCCLFHTHMHTHARARKKTTPHTHTQWLTMKAGGTRCFLGPRCLAPAAGNSSWLHHHFLHTPRRSKYPYTVRTGCGRQNSMPFKSKFSLFFKDLGGGGGLNKREREEK